MKKENFAYFQMICRNLWFRFINTPLFISFLFVVIFMLIKCQSTPSNEPVAHPVVDNLNIKNEISSLKLYVTTDQLRLRAAPNLEAETLKRLSLNEHLFYLDERTSGLYTINIGGCKTKEPWLRVQCEDGKEGWIFGDGVRFYQK